MATKTSKLKAVDPKATEPSKPKILIYGKPGVGKTWASLDFPSVYYIDTEGGADLAHYTDKLKKSGGGYLGVEQGSLDFVTLTEQVEALATEEHQYKSIVIDSISALFNLVVTKEGERLGDKNQFGADKKPAVAYLKRLLQWLNKVDMNVLLISHEKSKWGVDNKGNRCEMGVTFDCWDKLEYELHLCLRIEKNGLTRESVVGKSRLLEFQEGQRFPWSYLDFAKKYGQEIVEKKSEKLVLATPEQIAELNGLLDVFRVEGTDRDKWFAKANVESYAEMKTDQIAGIINLIKNKLNKEKK